MAIDGFTEPKYIAGRLNKIFKTKHFDEAIVGEWCAQVEVEYINDLDSMWEFRAVPLVVGNDKMVMLPCNVFKIDEVYDDNKDFLSYNRTKDGFLTDLRVETRDNEEVEIGDTIYISYHGVPINVKTGEILIPSGHQPICETYCKVRMFEEDAGYGKFSMTMWQTWDQKFSGQIQAIRSSHKNIDRTKKHHFQIIMGNMLPKIGRMTIKTEQFS